MNTSRIYLLVVIVTLLTTAGSAFAVPQVPEPVSTAGLFGIAIVGLVVGRKFLRK